MGGGGGGNCVGTGCARVCVCVGGGVGLEATACGGEREQRRGTKWRGLQLFQLALEECDSAALDLQLPLQFCDLQEHILP